MNKPTVFTAIPTAGKNLPRLAKCLKTLTKAAAGIPLNIVVVLCPSEKTDPAAVQKACGGNARVLPLPGPFNYPRSCNTATEQKRDEPYVLFLNDDCFFRHSGDLGRLIQIMDTHNLACTGPWVKNRRGHDGYESEKRGTGFVRTKLPILGCCALWDSQWLKKTGKMDEEFGRGYGFDEADMHQRVKALGGTWGRNDDISVIHENHATFGTDIFNSELYRSNLARWHAKYPGQEPWG